MREIRCQRCHHMFTVSREWVETALKEMEQKGQDHTNLECPKCRHTIKVPRADLERMRPHSPGQGSNSGGASSNQAV
jgi:hypothetical protein